MQVYIMRGIPGSGKTTWAEAKRKESNLSRVCSADNFHIHLGVYKFDPAKAAAAHNGCLRNFLTELENNECEMLFCDNTNTTAWEISPYYRLAEMFGHKPTIIQMHCPIELALTRNTHHVPTQTLMAMLQNMAFDRLPHHWNLELICGGI